MMTSTDKLKHLKELKTQAEKEGDIIVSVWLELKLEEGMKELFKKLEPSGDEFEEEFEHIEDAKAEAEELSNILNQ